MELINSSRIRGAAERARTPRARPNLYISVCCVKAAAFTGVLTVKGEDSIWLTDDDIIGSSSAQGNPYLFTGRRVDILDNGSLKIQHNRNRYYDYYTGRWTTHDPLGITPNPEKPNVFGIVNQYTHTMNLCDYVASNPLVHIDPFGFKITVLDPRPWIEKDIQFVIDFLRKHDSTGLIAWVISAPQYKGKVKQTTVIKIINSCGICPNSGSLFVAVRLWHWWPHFTIEIGYPKINVNPGLLAQYHRLAQAAKKIEKRKIYHEMRHVQDIKSVYTPFDTLGLGAGCSRRTAIAMADSMAKFLFRWIFDLKGRQLDFLSTEWDRIDRPQGEKDIKGYIEEAGYPL